MFTLKFTRRCLQRKKGKVRVRLQVRRMRRNGKTFDKDLAEALAASDKGSYFEQEKLLALEAEQQEKETGEVSASRSKIAEKKKEEPEVEATESWQKLSGRTIVSCSGLTYQKPYEISVLSLLSSRCDFA